VINCEIIVHGLVIVQNNKLLSSLLCDARCSEMLGRVDCYFVTGVWDNLSVPSSRVLGQIGFQERRYVCMFLGLLWQATDVVQPSWLIVLPDLELQLWPLEASAPADASRTPVAEVGTYGRGRPIIWPKCRLPRYI
jgi:hypothetical protein